MFHGLATVLILYNGVTMILTSTAKCSTVTATLNMGTSSLLLLILPICDKYIMYVIVLMEIA